MRDSGDARVRWLWERMLVSTRPDPSDAGMTWFLATGKLDYVQLSDRGEAP